MESKAPNAVMLAEHDALDWVGVASSNVEAIAYVPDFKRLWVRFIHTKYSKFTVYYYLGIAPGVWEAFKAAQSKGIYLDAKIKKGGYGYVPFL